MRKLLLVLGLVLVLVHAANAAVSVNATGTRQTASGVTSHNYTNITVAALSDTALVCVASFTSNVTGVTANWDSTGTPQAMAQLKVQQEQSNNRWTYIFGLLAPTTGNKTLAWAWTTSSLIDASCMAFNGVTQVSTAAAFTDVVGAAGTGGTASVTITTASGDATVSSAIQSGSMTSPSQTIFMTPNGGVAQYALSTGSSDIHSWTAGATWGVAGVRVNQVGAGGGDNVDFFRKRISVQ